jgi:hypothetical protein
MKYLQNAKIGLDTQARVRNKIVCSCIIAEKV